MSGDVVDRKPIKTHPDAEASNALADFVYGRLVPYTEMGHTPFSARYGVAGDFLEWLDEHRPRWREEEA